MLNRPLASVDEYVAFLSGSSLPVFQYTQQQLEAAREDIDRISGKDLSRIVLQDPMLAVKVLYYIQPFRGKALRSDITTIGGAIMMLGVEPFFAKFSDLPTIEDRIANYPEAIAGVWRLNGRLQIAARYAHDWAVWRHDLNVEEVTLAALLHDLAEVLIWAFAPQLALDIQEQQRNNRGLRSALAQQQVLGIRLQDLQAALCRAWHLPELLQMLMDDQHAEHPRVRNVALAVRLARHSANGWDDPALPDDYREVGELLGTSAETVMERIGAAPPGAMPCAAPAPDGSSDVPTP